MSESTVHLELHQPSETTSQHSDEWRVSPIFKDHRCSEWLRYSRRSQSYKVKGTGWWLEHRSAAHGRGGLSPTMLLQQQGGTQPPRAILGALGSHLCQVLMALGKTKCETKGKTNVKLVSESC